MRSGKGRAPAINPIEARKLLLNAIAGATAPLSAKHLGTLPELGRKVSGTAISKWLADDLQSGGVHWWGSGKTRGLWNRDPKDAAHDRLLEIAAAELLGRTMLEKRAAGMVPAIGGAIVKSARATLLAEGQLREVAAPAGVKGKIVINAARPEPYLQAAIAHLLDSFGISRSPERIQALLGVEQPPAAAHDEQEVRDTAEKIFAAMNRIAFSPGTTVTFYRLRQQPELVQIPKQIFDRAALLLESERRALLSIHDHATALSAEERESFVTDGLGKYYVSIYAR